MLYIHIPFCKQACHYCDFHFSTNLALKDKMVESVCREIESRKSYLTSSKLDSIYFGGGTPSLLSQNNLEKIFDAVRSNFDINPNAEITLEANPDDLNEENLKVLKSVGINRLSIGIQTFDDQQLTFLNRAHSSSEASKCIELAQKVGFENISVDLIYGIPSTDHTILKKDLNTFFNLGVNHISAYCLTIEPKTTFGNWLKTKKMTAIDDEFAAAQFEIVMHEMAKNDFEQYEISNFAKKGQYSKHNSQYWTGSHYLGIGPSAHSFNGKERQANIPNNNLYIKGIETNEFRIELEKLTQNDKTNEYLLTSIRTIWGTNLEKLESLSEGKFTVQNLITLEKYISKNWLIQTEGTLKLTHQGKYFADLIASDLFID